jgi:peptidoglycan L-alanyl-D-glutamate endopeptidase CwlK
MGFNLSQRSLMRLDGVDPRLVAVVKKAIQISDIDFMVVEGLRSREQCMINYGKGRTAAQCEAKGVAAKYANPGHAKVTWLNNPFNSKHCKQTNGYGAAVDLLPAPYDWKIDDPKHTPEVDDGFAKMAIAMLQAATLLGTPIRWGANWNGNKKFREKGETDNPHFELV